MYRTAIAMPAALLAASIVVVPATEARAFGDVAVQAQAMGNAGHCRQSGCRARNPVLAPPMVEEAGAPAFSSRQVTRRRWH